MPQAREEFAYLQVDRPVLEGAEAFLAKAQHIGRRIMGEVIRASVTEYAMVGDDHQQLQALYNEVAVGVPNVKMSEPEDLRVILLHRRVRAELGTRYDFSHHASRLRSPDKPVYPALPGQHTSRFKKVDVYTQLDQVSLDSGVDPDELTLMCDRVNIVHKDALHGVLALFPQEGTVGERVIQEQVRVSELRIAQQSPKIAKLPTSSTPGAIRIGSVVCNPGNENDCKAFLEEIQESLPVRLVVGGVSGARFKDGRRKSAQR